MIKYAETHEWIDDKGRVGISKKAREELGEIVYIELPKVGQTVRAGEEIAVLESTKAAVDLYSPVSGKITAINEKVKENPSLLNQSPEGEGYLFEMILSLPHELDSLTSEDAYLKKKESALKP
jgi:glycine cleavage system H protein